MLPLDPPTCTPLPSPTFREFYAESHNRLVKHAEALRQHEAKITELGLLDQPTDLLDLPYFHF